ncbi:MAG: hypothetical protein E7637_06650 [Ruminococcaceae bacterium]|nr:hypothetical protein [Oscillospiraceae bacterium]
MMKKRILKIVLISVSVICLLALALALIGFIRYRSLADTGLPRIDVVTENKAKIDSKTEYVGCTVSLSGTEEEFCFDSLAAGIRGRGNDTWKYYPKKPYRIKFEEKQSLFGEQKNKSWVLLALYNDRSLIKDYLAFSMADAIGTDGFVPSYHYVDLYVNGSYRGVYLLTDQVDENKGRTDVKSDFSETDTEVPFLVELDARAPEEGVEGVDWFSVYGHPYAIKYPEADERYTQEQFDYIKRYIEEVDALCRKENVTLAELETRLDVKSFIDFYLVQEMMGQPEINWKSVYMSREADGVLKMGPVWDFDWSVIGPSTGNQKNAYIDQYEGFRSSDNWFDALYQGSPEFREALSERWNEVRDDVLRTLSSVAAQKETLDRAAERDSLRWHWYRLGKGYSGYFDDVIEWCEKRVLWLDSVLAVP